MKNVHIKCLHIKKFLNFPIYTVCYWYISNVSAPRNKLGKNSTLPQHDTKIAHNNFVL